MFGSVLLLVFSSVSVLLLKLVDRIMFLFRLKCILCGVRLVMNIMLWLISVFGLL